jgi:hypothetical protein
MPDDLNIEVKEPEVTTEDAPVAPEVVEGGEKGEEEAAPAVEPAPETPSPDAPETLTVGG